MLPSEDLSAIKVLGQEHVAEILLAIQDSKVLSPSEIALRLRLQAPQVYRALDSLTKQGLVERHENVPTPVESWVFYSLSPKGRALTQSMFRGLQYSAGT